MATITRERRADADGEPIVCYFTPTSRTVYRYRDMLPTTLIDGGTCRDDADRVIDTYPSVADLERAVVALLS